MVVFPRRAVLKGVWCHSECQGPQVVVFPRRDVLK